MNVIGPPDALPPLVRAVSTATAETTPASPPSETPPSVERPVAPVAAGAPSRFDDQWAQQLVSAFSADPKLADAYFFDVPTGEEQAAQDGYATSLRVQRD